MVKLASIDGTRETNARDSAAELFDGMRAAVDEAVSEPVAVAAVIEFRDGSMAIRAAGGLLRAVGALEAAKLHLLLDDDE